MYSTNCSLNFIYIAHVSKGAMSEDEESQFVQRPFLCRINDDVTLTGVSNQQGHIEWEWSRVCSALKLGTEKDGLMLKRGEEEFREEFMKAQCSFQEFHYRGRSEHSSQIGQHSMESRAFLLMLCLFCLRRQTKVESKSIALQIVKVLLERALAGSTYSFEFVLPTKGPMGTELQCKTIEFSNGTTSSLADWVGMRKAAASKWKGLGTKAWCSHKIATTLQQASAFDMLLWLLHMKSTSTTSPAWDDLGQLLWPKTLYTLGCAIEKYAMGLTEKKPEPAPLLRSKRGNPKRTPWVNKLCLLKRLKKNKSHRKVIMQSHDDMVPPNSDIVVAEPLLECSLYLKLLRQTFENCNQFQISWDPSNYSGDDVMVCAVWSNQCNTAAYLPIQYVQPIEASELDVEFKVLAQRKQITRVDGYNELRAVAHAMKAVGKDFEMFEVPSNVLWKPLKKEEKRVFRDGKFWIVNTITGDIAKQIPDDWSFHSQHSLVSISDQGGINRGVLDFAQHMLPLSLVVGYDGQHRTWNDLKASLRSSGLFRTFLGVAIIFNVGYGPAGSKTWWGKKVAALKAFAANKTCNEEPFLGYMGNICQEREEVEDGSEEQREKMWNAMLNMKGTQVHGPLTKLMRWFSWWESYQFHKGELWFTRLIMLYGSSSQPVDDDGQVDSTMFDKATEGMSPQQELRYLKMKLGCWALAPASVNKKNLWQAALIFEGGRTLWTNYTSMAKNVKTAEQVQDHLVKMVAGGWKAELAGIVRHCLSNVSMMKKLYADSDDVSQEHLNQHWKFICQLVSERAVSLVAQCCKPPWRYAGLCKAESYAATSIQMQQEWELILLAERLAAEGHNIKPLDQMHFLGTTFVRLHFLANELDIKGGLGFEDAHAVLLAQTACRNIGDTVIIENTHQKMKDLMSVARHEQVGRLSKLHAMIKAGVLEGRGLPTLKVSDEDKVFASGNRQGILKIRQATHPNSHKMKKHYQNVMKYKASSPGFTWPSSSHTSLFFGICTSSLFYFVVV